MSSYVGDPFPPVPPDRAASYFYHLRRTASSAAQPTTDLNVGSIASVNNLAAAFDMMTGSNGRAPGPDGLSYPDVGRRELYDLLRPVSQAVINGTYRPAPGRNVDVPKSNGRGYRTLTLRNLIDRIVAKALTEAMTRFWETVFLNGSHGFRPGRSHLTMLAALENVVIGQDRWVLVGDDVKSAFDSVVIQSVVDAHRRCLTSKMLLDRLIEPVLRGGDPARTVGIGQGCPYSPTALNVHLHRVFDAQPHGLGGIPGPSTPRYRYADNLVAACRDVQEGRQALLDATRDLGSADLALKGENGGEPIDLTRGGRLQLLGFTLFRQGGKLRYKLGQESWEKLKVSLLKAHEEAECPGAAAQAAVRGWLASHGPAFHDRTDRLVDRLLCLTASLGFRELYTREFYVGRCKQAWRQWRTLVRTQGQASSTVASSNGSIGGSACH